jgi:tetratricopeptide (TPR) repeat protein
MSRARSAGGAAGRRAPLLPAFAIAALAAGVGFGCGGDGGHERVPLDGVGGIEGMVGDLPAEVQLQLDSGNAAYRDRNYARALDHFEEVVRLEPELAVGWYGVGMTHSALGNQEAADSAMARVHRLSPEIPLEHPGPRN